ncbi:MAG: hypothetical protein ACRDSH_12090 [Pseudonocardiaceae bacterium]
MRSPRHLAGTVLVLAVLGFGLGHALPEHEPITPAPAGGYRSHQSGLGSRPELTEVGVPGQARPLPPSVPAPDAALAVARSWVQAFLNVPNGITAERWAEQLRPYSTDDLFPELRSVDPANVPVAQMIDQPRTVSAAQDSAEVDVPTTAVVLRLLLVSTPTGWRVASYERVG